MGNCCGKESENFQGEGRTLGASPATAPSQRDGQTASTPKISGPKGGRTLGKNPQAPDESSSPGQAAAKAAEARVQASRGQGKLGKQLDAQKAQTQTGALAQSAKDNVAQRDADASAQAVRYD